MISAPAFLLFCAFPLFLASPYMYIDLTIICGRDQPYSYVGTASVWDDDALGNNPVLADVRFSGRGVIFMNLNGTISSDAAGVTHPFVKVRHSCTDNPFEMAFHNLDPCPNEAVLCNYTAVMDITPTYTPTKIY